MFSLSRYYIGRTGRLEEARMIRKILHTRYRVDDMEKTVAFYRDALGLTLTRRSKSGRGSELAFFKAPESDEEIEICRYPASGPVTVGPDLTHLALLVDDLDEVAALSCALDLTLGFLNATSNIAAACGAPTWIISVPGAWTRLGSDRLPWYPQARVLTPVRFADWSPVMSEVAGALAQMTA